VCVVRVFRARSACVRFWRVDWRYIEPVCARYVQRIHRITVALFPSSRSDPNRGNVAIGRTVRAIKASAAAAGEKRGKTQGIKSCRAVCLAIRCDVNRSRSGLALRGRRKRDKTIFFMVIENCLTNAT